MAKQWNVAVLKQIGFFLKIVGPCRVVVNRIFIPSVTYTWKCHIVLATLWELWELGVHLLGWMLHIYSQTSEF